MGWRKAAPIFLSVFAVISYAYFSEIGNLTNLDDITLGKRNYQYQEFINEVAGDLNFKKKVKLYVGPYNSRSEEQTVAFARHFTLTYFIFIDEGFLNELSESEKRALVGHELGHIKFPHNDTIDQMGADRIALEHTSPEAVKGFLVKLYKNGGNHNYLIRMGNIENLQKHQN
ncbi:MAG: hypothetical protein A3J46_02175 [Candidatus Yanofskybacteria bacterium RIFCSPHIGHO2_02_FULL_41_11]|uniref:Peptidase M48 domain-containing protein n=1 Tax=Candidatus Yanofskybacteria bacterium RIFCSPHIGHO2_02_FULL_41_11 TaxID=1802675 RepID=A0A1F8FB89_9BACT|nr:MAG: hypothetical protein A3J46_02175 [Candidatus Yanofskybacteria bacterium RIFCSPHIGHO2_02_FULL_41_11]